MSRNVYHMSWVEGVTRIHPGFWDWLQDTIRQCEEQDISYDILYDEVYSPMGIVWTKEE